MLFAAVLLDGLGLPLPGELALIGAGVAARTGLLDPVAGFAVAVVATLAGHCAAYWAGRVLVTRLSPPAPPFAPGPGAVLLCRFLVGLRVVLCPLAGAGPMRFRVFLVLDAAGASAWVGAFMVLGYAGGTYVDVARAALEGIGTAVLLGLVVAAALVTPVLVRTFFMGAPGAPKPPRWRAVSRGTPA
jgi:membrane protein DedA with SNARE-associated domain